MPQADSDTCGRDREGDGEFSSPPKYPVEILSDVDWLFVKSEEL